MGSSLHTRLLLSYGLLIAVLLCLVSAGSLWALLRNPLVYEKAALQLRSAQKIVNTRKDLFQPATPAAYSALVEQIDRQLNVRAVLIQNSTIQFADSQGGSGSPLRIPAFRLGLLEQGNEIGLVRDQSGRVWLAIAQRLNPETTLVLAVRRPRLAILEFFTSELLRPATTTGLIGLVLSALISVGMMNWITRPIKRINEATDAVAAGRFQQIQPEGPSEVKRLAASFNRMVRRVQDAQQSQRDLVANVSHELKTPLTSIQGFTQAILDEVMQTPQEIHQAAEIIYTETNRMSRLVQDLVSLARFEAGTADLKRTPVNITPLIQAIVEKFQLQVNKANLQLTSNAPDLPSITGDEDRLAQVLSNLVDNAIKYTPAGGKVMISARSDGGTIQIRVADNGIGIPPAEKARIFDRFYQSDRSRSGMGLGLAITRQIVIAHGGTIQVVDNAPKGCVFIVNLPITEPASSRPL